MGRRKDISASATVEAAKRGEGDTSYCLSCKRSRLKSCFSPGRACCAECLKRRRERQSEKREMGRRQKQAAEVGDAIVARARDAALAAARAGGAVGPFAALSGLMGGVGGVGVGPVAPAALGAGVDFAQLAVLGLLAPAALAQSRAALLGGAGSGPAQSSVAPAPGFSAADVAALARAIAEGAAAPGAKPPGASESAGAGAAWGRVAAETRGGAAGGDGAAAEGSLALQNAADAQAKSLQALSALAAQRPAPPDLPVLGLSGLAGLGALAAAGNLSALQAAYAGGFGAGAGFPGLGGGVPRHALSNLGALHALGMLGGLPGAAAAAAPPGPAAVSDAGTLRALEAMVARARGDAAGRQTLAEGEAPSSSRLDSKTAGEPADKDSNPLANTEDLERVPTKALPSASSPSPPRDEKETENLETEKETAVHTLKATGVLAASEPVAAPVAAKRSPSPPARAPRANPFGAEPEGYSLVHAAKRAKRDAIAVANHPDAEAE